MFTAGGEDIPNYYRREGSAKTVWCP